LSTPLRGQVYMADLGYGAKPFVIVSSNDRNARLGSCLAARITTTPKPTMPSIVVLSHGEPVVGSVLGDIIVELLPAELGRLRGALSPFAMRQVGDALRVALAL
jgi:mRNA interferase MazF